MHRGVIVGHLLQFDRFDRASAGAGAALHALIGVDHVLAVALGDDAQGAGLGTGAAADASVGNEVCHFVYLHKYIAFAFLL